jgi:two-component system, LytTR family, sensor histidine kinase AgrC
MNTILLVLCNALSCFIISTILFQFMNGKYKKSSRNRYVYIVIETTTVIFTFCINMLNHSILNLVVWGVLTGIIVYVLYYEDIDKPLRRIIECEALVFCMSVCESLGVILLQCILQAADINRFVKKSDVPYSKTRYIMYGIILLYSLINMSVIVENFKNGEENYLCAVNMGCIVLADLYLLYFVKMADEKNYYEKQLIALEQQAKVQYEYYLTQAKKYDQTIQILHDVNKHIKAIEGLYGAEQEKTAGEYATKIRELLKPLIPVQYTENPILNILLTDKESVMREKGISVTIKVDNVNLNFIEPIDITTIFGNLLDNAIEATEKLKGEKYICIKIGSYHKMIVVSIENNCNEVKWRNGFPVSNKGKNGGIGLLNVQSSIKKYDGDLTLKNDGNKFAAELFLNS